MTSHFLSPLSRISLFLLLISLVLLFFFFFHDTATPEIYTFPYTTLFRSGRVVLPADVVDRHREHGRAHEGVPTPVHRCRSEEHTSELQSLTNLVCRLLLEKKKNTKTTSYQRTNIMRRAQYRRHIQSSAQK